MLPVTCLSSLIFTTSMTSLINEDKQVTGNMINQITRNFLLSKDPFGPIDPTMEHPSQQAYVHKHLGTGRLNEASNTFESDPIQTMHTLQVAYVSRYIISGNVGKGVVGQFSA